MRMCVSFSVQHAHALVCLACVYNVFVYMYIRLVFSLDFPTQILSLYILMYEKNNSQLLEILKIPAKLLEQLSCVVQTVFSFPNLRDIFIGNVSSTFSTNRKLNVQIRITDYLIDK